MKKQILLSMAVLMTIHISGCSSPQNAMAEYSDTATQECNAATTAAKTTEAPSSPVVTLGNTSPETNNLSWDMAEEILTHISDPKFPDYSVNVLDYGAVPNDGQLDTAAIQKAIDETSEKGGGTVRIPSGDYDTGALTLKNNVNLSLEEKDTVLKFTREITPENYPLVFAQ